MIDPNRIAAGVARSWLPRAPARCGRQRKRPVSACRAAKRPAELRDWSESLRPRAGQVQWREKLQYQRVALTCGILVW